MCSRFSDSLRAKENEDFDQELVAETDEPRPEMSEEQRGPTVLLPKKVTVERHAAGLTVTYHWRRWWGVFVAAIGIGLFLASFVFYGLWGWSLCLALLWIPFAYAGIAHWVNRTTFHVTKQEILVSGGPMPWYPGFGSRRIQVSDLRKLVVTQEGDPEEGGELYTLRAILKGGKNVLLLRPDSASAHLIKRQIDRYLGRTHPRSPEAQKLLQEFTEELTRRGFEVSPRSERLYYHPDIQDVRFTIQQRVIRLEKRNRRRRGQPWERDESFSIPEIPLALEAADRLVGQSKRRHT